MNFLECGLGTFGKNCAQSCDGCLMTECKADTGECKNLSGCRPGWKNKHTMCNISMYKKFQDDTIFETFFFTTIYYYLSPATNRAKR